MRYDVVVSDPFEPERRLLLRVPFEVVGVIRDDGVRFISVSSGGGAFDCDGNDFVVPKVNADL